MPDDGSTLRVYLSSTYKDLIEHRKAAAEAIHAGDCHCRGMEDYYASDERPLDKCLADVATCDLYIGLFAHRYGFRPHGEESITELEFQTARGKGIPTLIFLVDTKFEWPPHFVDTKRSKDGKSVKKLHAKVGSPLEVSFFTTPQDLKQKVTAAVLLNINERLRDQLIARSNQVSEIGGELTTVKGERDDLLAAVETVDTLKREGSTLAAEALEEIRGQNDPVKLQQVLTDDADRLEQSLVEVGNDYIDRCREIAAIAYLRGDIAEAKKRLQIILRQVPNDWNSTNCLGLIQILQGELLGAVKLYRQLLESSPLEDQKYVTASHNLGKAYQKSGKFDQAEKMFSRALKISKRLSWDEAMAAHYSGLGIIYQIQWNLNKAEQMHHFSLAIEKKLDHKTGIAGSYLNLGIISKKRKKFDQAKDLFLQALKICEALEWLEGMAHSYGNLGVVFCAMEDYEQAKEMNLKALEIDEILGRVEGLSIGYNNLGAIYLKQEQLDQAEKMFREAIDVAANLGSTESEADAFFNLGFVLQKKKHFNQAETMYLRALEINKQLDRAEGLAYTYTYLGDLYDILGDFKKTLNFWRQAKFLFGEMGMESEAEHLKCSLDSLENEHPDQEPAD